jgi:hypothetical protein
VRPLRNAFHPAMQNATTLAQFVTCFLHDKSCSGSQGVQLELQEGKTYMFLLRGSHGQVGPISVNFVCTSTTGGLPSWLTQGWYLHAACTVAVSYHFMVSPFTPYLVAQSPCSNT